MRRVARVGLLLAHHRRPDLCRVADPQLVSQLGQHALEPARVASGFDTHSYWPLQLGVEGAGLSVGMFQTALAQLAGLGVQHRNLLVARV